MKLYINENLKKLRLSKNLTQEQFVKAIGSSVQSVSRWETGMSYPELEMIPTIAMFFGVTIDEIVGMEKVSSEELRIQLTKRLEDAGTYEERLSILQDIHIRFPSDVGTLISLFQCMAERGEIYHEEMLRLLDEMTTQKNMCRRDIDEAVMIILSWVSDGEIDNYITRYGACWDVREDQIRAEWLRIRKYI